MLDHAPRDEGRQVWVIEDGVQRPLQIRLSRLPSIQRHAENRFYGGVGIGVAPPPGGAPPGGGVLRFPPAFPRGDRGIPPTPEPARHAVSCILPLSRRQ